MLEEQSASYIKMDYTLKTAEARKVKVLEILANTPSNKLTPRYLEKLTDYITEPITKEERKEKYILTNNRMVTINDRETSFEGLVSKLENSEDSIYNMIRNDKNIIFKHKIGITEEDLQEIPELKNLHDEIIKLENAVKLAQGSKAYHLRKQLIEMYKDQYIIKNSYKKPISTSNLIKSISKFNLQEKITINPQTGEVTSDGIINLFNEDHVSLLLCNYSKLKEDSWEKVQEDMKWLMEDLDNLIEETFAEYPLYYDLIIYKIDGKTNAEIQSLLYQDYDIKHSVEYLSSLWQNKIPKMIVKTATNNYLLWYYTNIERGKWKKCSRCGQIKLAHNNFFSKNKTSKDGWYSICKECRNKKPDQKKIVVGQK